MCHFSRRFVVCSMNWNCLRQVSHVELGTLKSALPVFRIVNRLQIPWKCPIKCHCHFKFVVILAEEYFCSSSQNKPVPMETEQRQKSASSFILPSISISRFYILVGFLLSSTTCWVKQVALFIHRSELCQLVLLMSVALLYVSMCITEILDPFLTSARWSFFILSFEDHKSVWS